MAVIEQWELDHGPMSGYQLIEPVDGFHPNQVQKFKVRCIFSAGFPINPLNPGDIDLGHNETMESTSAGLKGLTLFAVLPCPTLEQVLSSLFSCTVYWCATTVGKYSVCGSCLETLDGAGAAIYRRRQPSQPENYWYLRRSGRILDKLMWVIRYTGTVQLLLSGWRIHPFISLSLLNFVRSLKVN